MGADKEVAVAGGGNRGYVSFVWETIVIKKKKKSKISVNYEKMWCTNISSLKSDT